MNRFPRFSATLAALCLLSIVSCSKNSTTQNNTTNPGGPVVSQGDSVYTLTYLKDNYVNITSNVMDGNVSYLKYDSALRQVMVNILDTATPGSGARQAQSTYSFDSKNRLLSIATTLSYNFGQENANFQYDGNGNLAKAVFENEYGYSIENDFTTTVSNGNTVITQYDTVAPAATESPRFDERPAIITYTFNASGQLISQHAVSSSNSYYQELYNDTTDIVITYDANNQVTKIISNYLQDIGGTTAEAYGDTLSFVRDNTPGRTFINSATITKQNLYWLSVADHSIDWFPFFSGAAGLNGGSEQPLISTSATSSDTYYTSTSYEHGQTIYQNVYNPAGLLTQSTLTTTGMETNGQIHTNLSYTETKVYGYTATKK